MATDLVSLAMGVITGLIAGVIAEEIRFRHSSKIERIKRVFPFLSPLHPILDKINEDIEHAKQVLKRNERTAFGNMLREISHSLILYQKHYEAIRREGILPQIEKLNSILSGHIVGVPEYAVWAQDRDYLSKNLDVISTYCKECEQELTDQLKE